MRGLLILAGFATLLIWWVLPPDPGRAEDFLRDLTLSLAEEFSEDRDPDELYAVWATLLRPSLPGWADFDRDDARVRREMHRFRQRLLVGGQEWVESIRFEAVTAAGGEEGAGDAAKSARILAHLPATGDQPAVRWQVDLALAQGRWMVLRAPRQARAQTIRRRE